MLSRCLIAAIAFCGSALLNAAPENEIASRDATVSSLKLHYLTAGQGPTVILLHGYTQTSGMWKPIIPLLAKKFTVIAPDLPGIGDSSVPADGLDMKTAAVRIHALAKFFFSSRRRHTRFDCDWSSDVCSSD